MEKFKELMSLCKASVTISVNSHKDYYETTEETLKDYKDEIEEEVYNEMIKRDTVVWVQAYPHTPVGFYSTHHYDIDKAIEIVLNAVKEEQ